MPNKERKHQSFIDGGQVFSLFSQAAGSAAALFGAPEYYQWRNNSLVEHWEGLRELYNSGVAGAINELNSVADRANHALAYVEASNNWGINAIQLAIIGMFVLDTVATPTPENEQLEFAPVGKILKDQAIKALKLGLALAAPVLLTETATIIDNFMEVEHLLQSTMDVLTIGAGALSIFEVGSRLRKRHKESVLHHTKTKEAVSQKHKPDAHKSPATSPLPESVIASRESLRNRRRREMNKKDQLETLRNAEEAKSSPTPTQQSEPLTVTPRPRRTLQAFRVASEEMDEIIKQEQEFEKRRANKN